jgi:hypothetical protein
VFTSKQEKKATDGKNSHDVSVNGKKEYSPLQTIPSFLKTNPLEDPELKKLIG